MNQLAGYFWDEEKRHLLFAIIGGISLCFSFFDIQGPLPVDPAWVAIVLCGIPILKGAIIGLVSQFDIKADVLVAMALVAAVYIGEIFAAGEVAFIMALGSLLEERTVRKAREGIEKLVDMTPRTARVLRNGQEQLVPVENIQVGETVRVLPGEAIPVDGVILAGQTAVDQSLMTGESLPVDKGVNDEVFSGTVNQLGAFELRAVKVGEDSSLQRMIRLVESADASKTPIVRIMDKWATWIVVVAFLTAIGTWLYTGELIRAVTILVVFCPCALVLSTPTAIMAGIGNATKFGVLISAGDALERLAQVKQVVFDKTGTLTHGKPEVVALQSFNEKFDDTALLKLAATLEQHSEHPLGRAIVRHAVAQGMQPGDAQQFTAIPGKGVAAFVNGQLAVGGTPQLIIEKKIPFPEDASQRISAYRNEGSTVICIGVDGGFAGIVVLADTLRSDA